jgi:hypothetical protein
MSARGWLRRRQRPDESARVAHGLVENLDLRPGPAGDILGAAAEVEALYGETGPAEVRPLVERDPVTGRFRRLP